MPAVASTIPAALACNYMMPVATAMYFYPFIFLSGTYAIYDALRVRIMLKSEVDKMYLLQNGD